MSRTTSSDNFRLFHVGQQLEYKTVDLVKGTKWTCFDWRPNNGNGIIAVGTKGGVSVLFAIVFFFFPDTDTQLTFAIVLNYAFTNIKF